jgi:hypothetical protein
MTLVTSNNNDIFEKLCKTKNIASNDIATDIDNDTTCLICNTSLDTNIVHTLNCKHKFHLDCIESWYITCSKKAALNHQNFKPQSCPYCRKKGGWLPLKENQTPIKLVHIEFIEPPKVFHKDLANKYVVKPKIVLPKCQAILKSQPGKKCSNYAFNNFPYCGLHKHYVPPPANPIIVPGKCCAIKANGTICTHTAKFGNNPNVLTHCGIHKKMLSFVATPVVSTPVVATPVVATPVVSTPVVATPVATVVEASVVTPVATLVATPDLTPIVESVVASGVVSVVTPVVTVVETLYHTA